MVGIPDQAVPDVLGILDRESLAAGGTFPAALGKGQRAGGRELRGRVRAVGDLHTAGNCKLEGVRRAENHHPDGSKAAATRRSPAGSLTWTC